MCGILGWLNFSKDVISESLLRDALKSIQHRGPDGQNVFVDRFLGFAHSRLAIIDLNERANQPFISPDNKYAIIFNGEIYNYRELKKELLIKGVIFSSESDTEVLLKCFIEEGPSFVHKLDGIFSFAIWNKEEETLFLCRDRLGVKPLYIYSNDKMLLFSSEIKPILRIKKEYQINKKVLLNYFKYRYHPGNETPFIGITHLDPGHWKIVKSSGEIKDHCYWSLNNFKEIRSIKKSEAIEQYYDLLSSSVSSQLVSDVPLGLFLSGGVDSASILSLASKSNVELSAFSLGMNSDVDEVEEAKVIALKRNVQFNSRTINHQDLDLYKKSLLYLEEPLADSILSATYFLSGFAREKVKVVLSGEGADEALGGYVHHKILSIENKIHKNHLDIPSKFMVDRLSLNIVQKLFPYQAKLGNSGLIKLREQFKYLGDWGNAYEKTTELFPGEFFSDSLCFNNEIADNWFDLWNKNSKSNDFLNNLTRLDLSHWNHKYTLLRLDKLTMAHGLEARVPFLNHKLVEFTLSLPENLKINLKSNKWILRETMFKKGILNKEEAFRAKKAFFLPVEKTYGKLFFEFAADNLLSQKALSRGFYTKDKLDHLLNQNYSELLISKQIMSLLIMELWAQLFIDGDWVKEIYD